jgi:hypothetical protein
LAFPLEQAEAKRVKRSNPNILHGIFIPLSPTTTFLIFYATFVKLPTP